VIAQPIHLQRDGGMLLPSLLLVLSLILSILGVVAQAAFA
jgi:hypothetical protein